MTIEEMIASNIGTIVDVRSPAEFMGGCVAGSINIPLQEIDHRISEIQTLQQPLILCCASGARSGAATNYLKAKGIDCHNAGGWMQVNYYLSKR